MLIQWYVFKVMHNNDIPYASPILFYWQGGLQALQRGDGEVHAVYA